jgi:Coenzyme PQQ synthesis protein D (PqqD)
MTQVNLASTVCHTENPVAADVAGETVLMSLERNRCYGLGTIGSEIWKRLQLPVRVGDLIENLTEEYDASKETIERDVLELLTQLADEGLIRVE